MSERKQFFMVHHEARRRAMSAVAEAPEGWRVTVEPPKRNLDQNALMWVLLEAFSRQLQWPVNGRMVQMEPEDWKHVLTAAFRKETARLAMGLDGGVVMLGSRTSAFTKPQMAEFIEFVQAVAVDRGVELERVPA